MSPSTITLIVYNERKEKAKQAIYPEVKFIK